MARSRSLAMERGIETLVEIPVCGVDLGRAALSGFGGHLRPPHSARGHTGLTVVGRSPLRPGQPLRPEKYPRRHHHHRAEITTCGDYFSTPAFYSSTKPPARRQDHGAFASFKTATIFFAPRFWTMLDHHHIPLQKPKSNVGGERGGAG